MQSSSVPQCMQLAELLFNFPRYNYFSNQIAKLSNRIAVFEIKSLHVKSNC